MSWDWDAKDIDPDKDDGWMWVPITPKTLEDEAIQTAEVKQSTSEDEEELCAVGDGPHQMMSMYVVSHGPNEVVQASTPIRQVVGMPIIGPGETNRSPSKWSGLPESSTGAGNLLVEQVACVPPKIKTG